MEIHGFGMERWKTAFHIIIILSTDGLTCIIIIVYLYIALNCSKLFLVLSIQYIVCHLNKLEYIYVCKKLKSVLVPLVHTKYVRMCIKLINKFQAIHIKVYNSYEALVIADSECPRA